MLKRNGKPEDFTKEIDLGAGEACFSLQLTFHTQVRFALFYGFPAINTDLLNKSCFIKAVNSFCSKVGGKMLALSHPIQRNPLDLKLPS